MSNIQKLPIYLALTLSGGLSAQTLEIYDQVAWNADDTLYRHNGSTVSSGTPLSQWEAAIGGAATNLENFENPAYRNTPVGPGFLNLNGSSVAGGAILTEADGDLWVAQGDGQTWWDVNNDGDEDLGRATSFDENLSTGDEWSLSSSRVLFLGERVS